MTPSTQIDDFHENRSEIIELQVGQQRFTALRSTLVEQSTYFKSLLSGRWNTRADGSYFVDADPDLFAHILNYLRRPDVFPLFYDNVKGHDFLKYYALLAEARYFGIDALAKWIEDRGYAKVLSFEYTFERFEEPDHFKKTMQAGSDTLIECQQTSIPSKVWVCPTNRIRHMGNKDDCERVCRFYHSSKERGPSAMFQDGPPVVVLKKKRTLLNIE
jgi:hypothetical protein